MGTLSDFAVQPGPTSKRARAWLPPDDTVRCNRVALCFDQTTSKAGWSVLRPVDGRAVVWDTGMIEPPQNGPAASHAELLARARYLFIQVLGLIEVYAPLLVLHESPPAGGKMGGRGGGESSLVAATAVECAAENVGLPVGMFQNQHTKIVMTNNGGSSKAQVKDAVLKVWPDLAGRGLRINQDVTDSIAGGLVWMKEHD
jgi:Holliday junction resolvasome RuvABC endonuclease subunit